MESSESSRILKSKVGQVPRRVHDSTFCLADPFLPPPSLHLLSHQLALADATVASRKRRDSKRQEEEEKGAVSQPHSPSAG